MLVKDAGMENPLEKSKKIFVRLAQYILSSIAERPPRARWNRASEDKQASWFGEISSRRRETARGSCHANAKTTPGGRRSQIHFHRLAAPRAEVTVPRKPKPLKEGL